MQSTTSSGRRNSSHIDATQTTLSTGHAWRAGDHFGTLKVVLTGKLDGPPNEAIIDAWRQKIELPAGIEKFSIRQARGDPPSKPIEIKLTGGDAETLKAASLEIQDILATLPWCFKH